MLGKHINICEDSLTAAVFTHLLYLPSELFWQILRNACFTDDLPEIAGEPLSIDPWPNWDSKGTDNNNRVIPDLFIRFRSFHLIIEAKRWDSGMQYSNQWKKEVTAYYNEYGNAKVPVKMIALGGIWGMKDEEVCLNEICCPVHMCKWERVLGECQRMKKELEGLEYKSSHTLACIRILTHLVELFACHGFSTGQWFDDFNFEKLRLSSSTISCLNLFHWHKK